MTKAQINLYILKFNSQEQDFNLLSNAEKQISITSAELNVQHTIKQQLDSLLAQHIDSSNIGNINYRLFNNIIIDGILHCIYFTTIPENTQIKNNTFPLSVKQYAIYSPNIQKIMQLIC